MKTLLKMWEEAGNPRPPFKYLTTDDEWHNVTYVGAMKVQVYFRDDGHEIFEGDTVFVKRLEIPSESCRGRRTICENCFSVLSRQDA